jgi:hypothetical protein
MWPEANSFIKGVVHTKDVSEAEGPTSKDENTYVWNID